jgi:transcriptional regulator with XRE-family HTH domain
MNAEKKIHHGRNIKRLREMIGMKQDSLALELGDDWTQQRVSLLEGKETIDDPLLQQVAGALKMPVEAIKNFDEQGTINIIANTFTGEASAYNENYKCNFNPLDKLMSVLEENKSLYERLLQSEREKIDILQKSR